MKLKSIIGLVLVPVCIVMLCIGSACADDPIPDYSAEVAAIIADDTLTSQEKLKAQTELFGWDIRLELWCLAKQYDPINMIELEPEYTQETLGLAMYLVYISGLNINSDYWYDLDKGNIEFNKYLQTFSNNYRSWE